MRRKLLWVCFILFFSCNNNSKRTYAINDFPATLQPQLSGMVTKGYVTYLDSTTNSLLTNDILTRLGQSEHPILRAVAISHILERDSSSASQILMNCLDDTAMVLVDRGEFGLSFGTVADYLLGEAEWESLEERNKTFEEVIMKHNYLSSAYRILYRKDAQEKYYPYIKDMATRPRRIDVEGYEMGFEDIEYALYGLAKYQRKEDIIIIKDILNENKWRLSHVSFELMKTHPDTSYFDILHYYYRSIFYRFSGVRRNGFSGSVPDKADPEDFIDALVAQGSKQSAMLLDTILVTLSTVKNLPDRDNIRDAFVLAIWQNPFPSYLGLREKIRNRAEKILSQQMSFKLDPIDDFDSDSSKKRVYRWYN